ncbi:MAG: hypothetical protein M3511_07320 [Deinococcota bacterium]|jgi:hypothetical protein|nr:hypothetical protein [Deinococcota bacterium]
MTLSEFNHSLTADQPPEELSLPVKALWHDKRGNWEKAHELAQQAAGRDGDWVHAYLHRKEGDEANARYWYDRAGKPQAHSSLDEEWERISAALLDTT